MAVRAAKLGSEGTSALRHERVPLWHDPNVDRAYSEEIASLLQGLLIRPTCSLGRIGCR